MKRFLALFLAFCMLVPFTAFAETKEVSTANVSDTSYNVYIEGESEVNSVSVILRNEDATDIAYVAQLTTDQSDNGKYFTKFKFNGDIANYGIYVRDDLTGADVSESVKTAVAKDELYTASLDVAVDADDRTYIKEGDAVNISVDIKNKYGDDEIVKVLVAAYDENKSLLAVKDTTLTALFADLDTTKDANTNFEVPANTKKVKVFIWNGTETMIPVGPSKALLTEDDAITVHLVGDSLCQTYADSMYPRQGWGHYIANHVAEGVKVNNTGIASRSTFSYLYGEPGTVDANGNFKLTTLKDGIPYYDYENSRWNKTFIEKAKPGDYVIIGLGINDLYQGGYDIWEFDGVKYAKVDDSYRTVESYNIEANTVTYGEEKLSKLPQGAVKVYSWIALREDEEMPEGSYRTYFKDNLRLMIETSLAAGVTPVLTSTTGHYTETNYEDTWRENPEALTKLFVEMKEVAEEYKDQGVVYLPLFEYTDEVFHEWGNKVRFDTVHLREKAYDWFKKYGDKPVTYYTNDKMDGVHYNDNGAKWVASHIMRLAYESGSSLKEYINEPDVYDIPMIR